MRILRAADGRWTDWRDGGGRTREVAAFPAGARLADFNWRISVAVVAGDGPFSRFPGVDRTLLVVGDAPLRLSVGDRLHLLGRDAPPLCFSGESPAIGGLELGPATVLNVMVRRGAFCARVERLVAGHAGVPAPRGPGWLVNGAHRAEVWAAGRAFALEAFDALVVDVEGASVAPRDDSASLTWITFDPGASARRRGVTAKGAVGALRTSCARPT